MLDIKLNFSHTSALLFALSLVAILTVPNLTGNGFFVSQVNAATTINSISHSPAPGAVFARELVTFTADVTTDDTGLVYVWSFGDGESAIAGPDGTATHLYDTPFASGNADRPTLRIYQGENQVASQSTSITVQAVQQADRASWPFARITRLDGPGPYGAGSVIDFRGDASIRGSSASLWNPDQTFQWSIVGSADINSNAKEQSVNIAAEPTGAFNFTSASAGWFEVRLRTNQLTSSGSTFTSVYDQSSHAFYITTGTPGSDAFDLTLSSPQTDLDLGPNTSEPFPTSLFRVDASITGGVVPFQYSWYYPDDLRAEGDPDFRLVTRDSFSSADRLNAEFRRSGIKRVYLIVTDGTFRHKSKEISYNIATSAPGAVPFEPTLEITETSLPINVQFVETANKPLTIQIGTGLSPPPQTYSFRATASSGTAPYEFAWSSSGRTSDECSATPTQQTCEYVFDSYGTHTVSATITDGSNPQQSETVSRVVVLEQEPIEPEDDGGGGGDDVTGTGGGDGGDTGGATNTDTTGNSDTGGTIETDDVFDPISSRYGLGSGFANVGLGKTDDAKSVIANIINIILGFLGILAVVIIVFGGFRIMTSSGNEEQTASGKKAVLYGVIGLVVIFAAWGIASFVTSNLLSATT